VPSFRRAQVLSGRKLTSTSQNYVNNSMDGCRPVLYPYHSSVSSASIDVTWYIDVLMVVLQYYA